jgi:hypothetical protein
MVLHSRCRIAALAEALCVALLVARVTVAGPITVPATSLEPGGDYYSGPQNPSPEVRSCMLTSSRMCEQVAVLADTIAVIRFDYCCCSSGSSVPSLEELVPKAQPYVFTGAITLGDAFHCPWCSWHTACHDPGRARSLSLPGVCVWLLSSVFAAHDVQLHCQ